MCNLQVGAPSFPCDTGQRLMMIRIRRIKCGEERPSCEKCTSTGRICDGYSSSTDSSPPQEPNAGSNLVYRKRLPIATKTATQQIVVRAKSDVIPHSPYGAANQDPVVSIPASTFRALPIPPSMSRAFEYFLKRSAVDLAGPLCIQVWGHYILSAATCSPAIQHGIAALSGIHERHGLPHSCGSRTDTEPWKHYYLAVKATNALVASSHNGRKPTRSSKEEILIACAIFITIEVLLGNLEAALRHVEGGFSLIQAYFTNPPSDSQNTAANVPAKSSDTVSSSPTTHIDSHLADLIGFFARLDLQMLSLVPAGRHSEAHAGKSLTHAPPVPYQALPNTPSESLHHIIKRSLSWIRHQAKGFKYDSAIPLQVYDAQSKLLSELKVWRTSCFADDGLDLRPLKPGTTSSSISTVTPETANLLLAYHLTALKVNTALSPSEIIFSTPDSIASFEAILHFACVIVAQRNDGASGTAAAQEGNFAQLVSFFSLEMSTVEALYYTAIKCRNATMHRRAVELLRSAGREGVWDGSIMAHISSHVVSIENGTSSPFASPHSSSSPVQRNHVGHPCSDAVLPCTITEKTLINEVTFTIEREANSAKVECGWYSEQARSWTYDTTVVTW